VLAPAIPAIMAGNAALVKVSEWTSWSAARIQRIFDEALRAEGHSVDLVQLITGYGPTGAALVTAGVDKIVFTGSIGQRQARPRRPAPRTSPPSSSSSAARTR
jgi:acyl-CoA reductase-like NAD-dependent aldehyde dehydrogenase